MDGALQSHVEVLAREIAGQARTIEDVNGLMRLMMKSALERMLDTEMDVHLGRRGLAEPSGQSAATATTRTRTSTLARLRRATASTTTATARSTRVAMRTATVTARRARSRSAPHRRAPMAAATATTPTRTSTPARPTAARAAVT